MNALRLAAVAALAGGIGLLGYATLSGQVDVGFFLVIPFVSGSGPAAFFGMLLLMLAAALWFLSAAPAPPSAAAPPPSAERFEPEEASRGAEAPAGRARSGGVVLIGPIPIVWGSDRRILPWMIGAGAILLLLGLLLTSRW